ncbi:MAG TPA: GNAT family N-acetyltransferase [Candidatus Nanoarchaeia archaeon]|nr:GNAT family N-acetyltransferase [Candidatus Nanoarchaeia archaeon]
MTINLRETREDDFEGIAALLRDTKLIDPYFSSDKFVKMLARNSGYCYVAEDNGKIVGSAFATHDGAFRGHIQKVAVAQEYRRQGVASRLVETIVERFEGIEIPLIFAHADKTNEASIGLLKSLGFEVRDTHYLIDRGYKPKKL